MRSTNLTTIRTRVGQFFHREEVPYGLAIVRIVLPLVLLVVVLHRWPAARELYSTDGAPAPLADAYGFYGLTPAFGGTAAVALFSVLVAALICSSIGFLTRISLIVAFGLYTYFNLLDAISTMTKYSVIASHLLLLLGLSNCGAVWSFDRRIRGHRGKPAASSVWCQRLMQILVATVYFGAGVTKLHTPAFFSGDQLRFWAMTNVNYSNPLGEYLTMYPTLFMVFSYITVVWELLFIFMVWRGWGRSFFVLTGAFFHIMTCLTLGLYIFPAICITSYAAFLQERDIRRIRFALRHRLDAIQRAAPSWLHWHPARPVPTLAVAGAFSVLMMSAAAAGLGIERRLDRYGLRRPEGKMQLKEVSADLVQEMLQADRPIEERDKFFSIEVGTTLVGGNLVNQRRTFVQGEAILVQCTMNPPYEDMWVECNLHDQVGSVIDYVGQVVPREAMRRTYRYVLDESVKPGLYEFVIRSAGEEIARRQIELLPGTELAN